MQIPYDIIFQFETGFLVNSLHQFLESCTIPLVPLCPRRLKDEF